MGGGLFFPPPSCLELLLAKCGSWPWADVALGQAGLEGALSPSPEVQGLVATG